MPLPPPREILSVQDLALAYGRRRVLAGVSFALPAGGLLGVVGPNGCGKTTLLRALIGALRPAGGRIVWSPEKGDVVRLGYVPQRDQIDPIYPFDAREVVLLALSAQSLLRPVPSAAERERAMAALARVGIQELAGVPYGRLSGGQRQRVLLARALAVGPEVLLLDEPVRDLDPAAAFALLALLDALRAEEGLTVVLVSHDLSIVADRATWVLALGEGGRHVAGPPGQILEPALLERLYGCPFHVGRTGGRTVVLPGKAGAP